MPVELSKNTAFQQRSPALTEAQQAKLLGFTSALCVFNRNHQPKSNSVFNYHSKTPNSKKNNATCLTLALSASSPANILESSSKLQYPSLLFLPLSPTLHVSPDFITCPAATLLGPKFSIWSCQLSFHNSLLVLCSPEIFLLIHYFRISI